MVQGPRSDRPQGRSGGPGHGGRAGGSDSGARRGWPAADASRRVAGSGTPRAAGRDEQALPFAHSGPGLPDEVTGRELDPETRSELRGLTLPAATAVSRHLVMAGRLIDDDPEAAYQHALAARRLASRVGVTREAAGVAAYAAGRYADALNELRAGRRITGRDDFLALMADCERGLGRPERALAFATDPAVPRLDRSTRVELLIVLAGARRDLGQLEAAAMTLQVPELRSATTAPWLARLRYAYADALLALRREQEARRWFSRAAEVDLDGDTDADARLAELDGVYFVDEPEVDEPEAEGPVQAEPAD